MANPRGSKAGGNSLGGGPPISPKALPVRSDGLKAGCVGGSVRGGLAGSDLGKVGVDRGVPGRSAVGLVGSAGVCAGKGRGSLDLEKVGADRANPGRSAAEVEGDVGGSAGNGRSRLDLKVMPCGSGSGTSAGGSLDIPGSSAGGVQGYPGDARASAMAPVKVPGFVGASAGLPAGIVSAELNAGDSAGFVQGSSGVSVGIAVAEQNRRFWEQKTARVRNRESGVQIKHFPELLGARKINISMDLWNKGVEKLDKALVGIVFGEKPNLGKVRGFARGRWQDQVKVAMLNEGIFLFKCATEELKTELLYGAPLTFNQKPFIFQSWSPDKSYTCSSVKSLPVWVKLPGLRAHLQEDADLLGMVCSVIGKPLRTDGYTAEGSMMTFARVCVEIYSDQEYMDSVTITDPYGDDHVQEIKYEWLPKRCVNCCCFGHLKEDCDMPSFEVEESEEKSDENYEESEEEDCEEDLDHCDPEDFVVESKDFPEDLENQAAHITAEGSFGGSGGDFAWDNLDLSRGFSAIPPKVQENPRKVPESSGESETEEEEVVPEAQVQEFPSNVLDNSGDSEREEGEVAQETQALASTPSLTEDILKEVLDGLEGFNDFQEAVNKKRKKEKVNQSMVNREPRELRSTRGKGNASKASSRGGRGRGKKR